MSLRTKLAAWAATGVMALGTGVLAATPAEAATTTTCPTYYACIYWGTTESSGIRDMWKYKGVYKIYNYYGNHLVKNSQTRDWKIWLCHNTNGTDCDSVWPGPGLVLDMTPYNSVSIEP
ncbi:MULTISPECIES: hypothetical protein [unclassified Streptomyces]|uniref:hypothetical protein n=1 Tax=unclassified Streptomyces TaxID=2593676 RepID=UPI002030C5E2|nr:MULTISPECIES: hypothetical protein [unclassified Streptomyces]MCM1965723.1 hypothetical protein [Streptomyces sp. G1]MCX5123841.1 hypothetical protein [Streptomyces sp. NBC_00347]MCX5297086.1 hypothetical protein [Streptomyces sp. NBC_00193]